MRARPPVRATPPAAAAAAAARPRLHALREERRDDPGEDVAGPRAREARRSRGRQTTDPAPGAGDERVRALEHDDRADVVRGGLDGVEPVRVHPRRRRARAGAPSSPACGVRTVGASRANTQSRWPASAQSPSASRTTGSSRRSRRIPTSSRVPVAPPQARADRNRAGRSRRLEDLVRGLRASSPVLVGHGRRHDLDEAAARRRGSATRARRRATLPAPARIAASDVRRRRAREPARAADDEHRPGRCTCCRAAAARDDAEDLLRRRRAARRRRREGRCRRPRPPLRGSGPGATTWPTFRAWNVTVSVACTAAPATSPVEASTPDGTSTATTGRRAASISPIARGRLAASARPRTRCRRARRRRHRRRRLLVDEGTPASRARPSRSPRVARDLLLGAAMSTTAASRPPRGASAATTKPSPPFAPVPHQTPMRRASGQRREDRLGRRPSRRAPSARASARRTPPRRRASPRPCRAARSGHSGSTTTQIAAASSFECVIERSIAPAPTRSRPVLVQAESRTPGFGRPAISISRHVNCRPRSRAPCRSPPCRRSARRSAAPGWPRVAVGALGLGEDPLAEARLRSSAARIRSISIRSTPTLTRRSTQVAGQVGDRVDHGVGLRVGGGERRPRGTCRCGRARRAGRAASRRPTSASTSSPTMTASPGAPPSAASAASKYAGLGLPTTSASTPAAYSSPATKAPESSIGPLEVCHQRLRCRQTSRAPASSSANARLRFRTRRRPPRLVPLVRAAEQDDVRVAVDELDLLGEIVLDGLHRQRQDALAPRAARPRRAASSRARRPPARCPARVGRRRALCGPSWCCS